MRKILVNLLSCFIPSRKGRHDFRNRFEVVLPARSADPWAVLAEDNDITIAEADKRNVSLGIQGKNNTVIIGKLAEGCPGSITIFLAGNNCTVIFEENIWVSQSLNILAGQIHSNFGIIENTTIHIGKSTSFETCNIITYNSKCSIEIGERCMFAYGITLFNTDAHPIYDMEHKNIINKVGDMKIGDHCWIGANSTILKNVEFLHDTIVGWGSVVGKKFYMNGNLNSPPSNCIIAGNPAKVVKTGVTWDCDGSKGYVQNEK